MTELQLQMQEKNNTGTAWTRNEFFEKNGYLVIKICGMQKNFIIQFLNSKDNTTIGIKI